MVSMRERGSWNTKRRSRRDGKTRRRGFSDRPLRREPKPKKGSPSLSLYFAFAFPLSEFFALNKKKKTGTARPSSSTAAGPCSASPACWARR